jgi:hypothetical protein
MVSDIDIKETIEDKKSWFNIKRFAIGNNSFERPEKSLDIKNLDQATYNGFKSGFKFYEATKIVRKYDNLAKLYNEDDAQVVDSFFYRKDWLSNSPCVINFTFEFNPFNHVRSIEEMSWFFNQCYPYSSFILTVPNIRINRRIKKKNFSIIDFDSYMRFVDSAFNILNAKNNKHIFVPLSMRMGVRKISDLVEHYLTQEYYNYWFDFEGHPINPNSLGRLRHVFDLIKKSGNFDRVVSYFTNVKREILANYNEPTSVASDALCAIAGANLVGVNREPQRYQPPLTSVSVGKQDFTIRMPTSIDPSHKARIFDRETYYYVKTHNADLFPKNRYVPVNAARLNAEFGTQSEYFMQHHNIDTLLDKKIVFKDEKAGNMLKELTSKPTDSSFDLRDFL